MASIAPLAACSGPQNFMEAAGPAARNLATLGWFVLGVFTVVSIVLWLLILWSAMRRRGSLDWHAPIDAHEGQRWIVVGGVVVPLIVLTVAFGWSLVSLRAFPMAHGADHPAQIRIVGRQWWFNAEYLDAGGFSAPTEIHVPVGQPVDISLETRDVIHSFWAPKLHGKVDLVPGQVNRIRIQADEPGMFMGQCGEYCGIQHAHMRIAIVAEPLDRYAQWLTKQSAPAATPGSESARKGAEVFQQAACPLCHTIRGTAAQGSVGPDLTHLASRSRIAGGMLPNNRANLQTWVVHAQSLKPGSQMPDLASFKDAELQSLVTYLQGLE